MPAFDATRTPQHIATALNVPLKDASRYRLQNTSSACKLFLTEAAAAPATNARAHEIQPGDFFGPFTMYRESATDTNGWWGWGNRDSCDCMVTVLPD